MAKPTTIKIRLVSTADTGFFYRDSSSASGHKWVKDPWANGFRDAPIPEIAKRELMTMEHFQWRDPLPDDWKAWLDSMTYKEFLERYVGITRPEVFDYLDPMLAATFPGLGTDVVSAYHTSWMPGPEAVARLSDESEFGNEEEFDESFYVSFPGGNAGIARHNVAMNVGMIALGQPVFEMFLASGSLGFVGHDL